MILDIPLTVVLSWSFLVFPDALPVKNCARGTVDRTSGRAQPNLMKTLAKLESAGFVVMTVARRRKVPSTTITKVIVEINPCSDHDRLQVA